MAKSSRLAFIVVALLAGCSPGGGQPGKTGPARISAAWGDAGPGLGVRVGLPRRRPGG